MRSLKVLLSAAVVLGMSSMAHAELQNVEVDGSIQIRGNWYDFDRGGDVAFVEQRTRLGVRADFTDEVSAYIEIDNYSDWGRSTRADWLTGRDGRGTGDVSLYQGYVEADKMWGTDLRLRLGRQEIVLGSGWLVGANESSPIFSGLSFDAIRASYNTDMFTFDAWWAKLTENFGEFADDDVDFYGIYGSYIGLEDVTLDAYWMWVRDDSNRIPRARRSNLHTVGLRGAGALGAFDFEAEAAYQFDGIKERRRGLFRRDRKQRYDAWGVNLEAGYTFDMAVQPRVYLGAAWLEGPDQERRRGIFHRRSRDLSFNRLFSDWQYSEFLAVRDASNQFIFRGGIQLMPTEAIELELAAAHFRVDEPWVRRRPWPFRDRRADRNLGWELGLYGDYHYTEDLTFSAGYAAFFANDGVEGGSRITDNGLSRFFANKNDTFHHLFFETTISF